MHPAKEKVWKQICGLFKQQASDAGEKFTQFLGNSGGDQLTILAKTIEYLNADGNENFRDFGAATFMKSVLQLMENPRELTEEALCDITTFVIVESRHLSSAALAKTVSYSLGIIGSKDELNLDLRWIGIFGKMLAVLSMRGEIEDMNGDMIDGQQYIQEVIIEICRFQWGPGNSAALIMVLREIPAMDANNLRLILDKAGSVVRELDPPAVPPIAYQLLMLAGSAFPNVVVGFFNDYFSSMQFDSDEDELPDATIAENRKALGTTVRHFVDVAKKCDPLSKELLKRIKSSQHCHSIITSPFMMSTALGLTGVERIKQTVLDAIKATLVRWFSEIHLSTNYSWYNKCTGPGGNDSVNACFATVLSMRTSDLDFMLDGIEKLGITLLTMEHTGSKDVQRAKRACNAVGDYLLVTLVSKRQRYLPSLVNYFLRNPNPATNMDCLARCLKKVIYPTVRKEYAVIIKDLINHLPLMTVETASPIIKAIIPSLQLSTELMDEFVLNIRKTVWKTTESRRVSVTATVLLLCNSRIIGDIPRSQYSNTQFFKATQLVNSQSTITASSSKNESICSEVLELLRRYFSQQFGVKELLYIGIYNVARQNPEIISFLCTHVDREMNKYLETESADRPKVNFLEMSENASATTGLPDPLGYLVQCLSFLLTRSRNIYSQDDADFPAEETPASILAASKTMEIWIVDLCESEDLNKNFFKLRKFDEKMARSRTEFLVQLMQVAEALMEYLLLGGKSAKQNALSLLFQKFNSLQSILKGSDKQKPSNKKNGKGAATKKGDTSAMSTSSSSDLTLGEDEDVFIVPKIPQKKVTYRYIMTTENLIEILRKLYATETDDPDFDAIRSFVGENSFENMLLKNLKQKIHALKQKEVLKERDKEPNALHRQLATIAGIFWNRSQKIPSEEDLENGVSSPELDEARLELAVEIVQCLLSRGVERNIILNNFLGESERTTYDEAFEVFFQEFMDSMKHARKYLAGHRNGKGVYDLFVLLEIFASELTVESKDALASVLTWFTKFLEEKSSIFLDEKELCPSHAEAILCAFIAVASKAETTPSRFLPIAKRAHFLLADLDGDTVSFDASDPREQFWLVTSYTAPTVLHQFAIYVENTLNIMKDVTGRLGCAYINEEKIASWRDNCCIQLQFLVRLLTSLVRSQFPVGPWVEVLRRATVQFFHTMATITESFVNYHTKSGIGFNSRPFDALIKAIGTDFKIRAEAMVHHIEEIRRKAVESEESKKSKDAAKTVITKDTKTIPTLIYSIEKYEQQLITLCEKTKMNLLVGTRLSAPRDFRILFTNKSKATTQPADTVTQTPTASTSRAAIEREEMEENNGGQNRKRARLSRTTKK